MIAALLCNSIVRSNKPDVIKDLSEVLTQGYLTTVSE